MTCEPCALRGKVDKHEIWFDARDRTEKRLAELEKKVEELQRWINNDG